MSTTDLFFVAAAFFAGILICWLWSKFEKNEEELALKAGVSILRKLDKLSSPSAEDTATLAAAAAHKQALREALKDAAAKL